MAIPVDTTKNSDELIKQLITICKAEDANTDGRSEEYAQAREIIEEELMLREADELHQQWLEEDAYSAAKEQYSAATKVSFKDYIMQRRSA